MEMHPIGDRAAFGDRDVRGNVAAAEPARDQVAVEHPRPALACRIAGAGEHEFRRERRQVRRRRAASGRVVSRTSLAVGQDRACADRRPDR